MFECMSQYGLGLEGATKALTVSNVVQREMAERKVSMMDAIDGLTCKLATANLVASTVSSAAAITSSHDDEVGMSVRPTRIQLVLAQARQPTATTASSTSLSSKTVTATASVSTRKAKSLNKTSNKQKNTSSAASRKRSAEETKSDKSNNNNNTKDDNTSNNAPTRRLRSDSLSEVVEAKFGSETPVEEAPVAVTTRSKRARGAEDAEASTSSGPMSKRSRTTGGL